MRNMIKDFDKSREKYKKKCFEFTAKKLRTSVNQDNFIVPGHIFRGIHNIIHLF